MSCGMSLCITWQADEKLHETLVLAGLEEGSDCSVIELTAMLPQCQLGNHGSDCQWPEFTRLGAVLVSLLFHNIDCHCIFGEKF